MQALDCCVHEVKAEPSPRDYHFILWGASQNSGGWTWAIERLALLSFEHEECNLFIDPWIKYNTKIE